MSIQARLDGFKQAAENLDRMTKGLQGLSDSIFPAEKISDAVAVATEPHKREMKAMMDAQSQANKEACDRCENLTGEAIQVANTITSHYESRLKSIEAKIEELYDMMEGFIEAASRRRR